MSDEAQFAVGFTARVIPVEGPIEKGDCLVYDPDYTFDGVTGVWRIATAENRADIGSTAEAIALTNFGRSIVGTVSYQTAGLLSQAVSGLDTDETEQKLVRVSTAGRLERVDAYTSGDDIIGYAQPNGRVKLHIGLPWQLIAALGGIAALPDYSLQYRKPDGTLGGMTGAFASSTGSALEIRTASEAVPATGNMRFSANSLMTRLSRDGLRTLWSFFHYFGQGTSGANQKDRFMYGAGGSSNPDSHEFNARQSFFARAESPSDATRFAQLGMWTDGAQNPAVNSVGFYVEPIFAIGPAWPFTSDPFRGAKGGLFLRYRTVDATSDPPAGWTDVFPDPTTGHLTQVLPDGTVFDLTETGDDETDNLVITADPTDDIDVNGIGSIESASASATVTIRSLTPPVAGKAKRVAISNQNGDSATLVISYDNGFTAEGGFITTTGGNFSMPFGMTLWAVWSETAQRYLVTVPQLEPGV